MKICLRLMSWSPLSGRPMDPKEISFATIWFEFVWVLCTSIEQAAIWFVCPLIVNDYGCLSLLCLFKHLFVHFLVLFPKFSLFNIISGKHVYVFCD